MDNGVETVDGSYAGEKKGVVGGVSELVVEGEVSLAGADGSRDSEADEVFEEANSTETTRVDVSVREDENVNQRSPREGDLEVEKFEEAIGVPSKILSHDEEPIVLDKKVEGLVEDEVEQNATEKAVRNVAETDGFEDSGQDEVREAYDLGGFEISADRNDGKEKSSVVIVKSENGDLDSAESDGVLNEANEQESQVLKASDANKVEESVTDTRQEIETNGEILHLVDTNVVVNGTFHTLDTENEHDKKGEMDETSVFLHSEHPSDKIDSFEDNFLNTNSPVKNDHIKELKGEGLACPGPGDQNGENDVEVTSENVYLEGEDDRGEELRYTSGIAESDHHEESCKLENDSYESVEVKQVTPDVGEQPSLEEPVVEKVVAKVDEIQASASELETEKCKGSQTQQVETDAKASSAVADEAGKKEANHEVVKQSTTVNREQEVKPAANVSSLAGKSAIRTPPHPAGLGRAAPLLEPAPRVVQAARANGTVSYTPGQLVEDPTSGEAEEYDETREKLQMIRVKFLRLAHRLGQTPHNVVVAQVLYRLGLAEQLRGRNGGRVAAFSFDRASAMAEQLEAAGQEPLDFSCTIMVLGKTGVGKSATINSIFDENKFSTDAFQLGTKKVQDVVGTVQGIKVRVIDTPGLLPSWSDQRRNEKILHSVRNFIQKSPPDIVLYLDRLDMQSRDFGDMPLLRTITEIFGPSIWFNAIVVLTHAASAPPEGPNGVASSYDMFVTQRSHVVQQAIRQAAGDMRLMNPVSLVENHSACRTNRAGQRVLPNGQIWKPHLLLLSFASKILAEANTLLKLQDSPPGKPYPSRVRAPPLHYLFSLFLQSKPQLKLPQEQFGDDDDMLDEDIDESSDSDDESEYDELPPFTRLSKAQLEKLTKAQRKAYYDELEYREKLFVKKQLKDEKKRRKMMKKMAAMAKDLPSDYSENAEEDSGGAASVPVPMPDLALPASFDSDNPTHRYRSLDSSNQWLVRPVLDSHGWDHDVGYEGINVEKLFVVKDKVPVSFSGQVTKDKKDTSVQMEVASSVKHGEGKATTVGLDMQTIGKDIAYTLRSETRFNKYRKNKAMAGLSLTLLGDSLTGGVKIEDKLIVNKRGQVVVTGGAIMGRGDVAYGGSLEATLRDKDYPLGRFLSTIGLSVFDAHGDRIVGWNVQSQIPVGRFTNLIGRFTLNNRGSGVVNIRLNSSEHLELALLGLFPLLRKLLPQPVQIGY
ncbi:hypothetical protein RJ639_037855 [Escallonia herrerae]|uniref:AIG1-type G domain-containing protein n=1 Tax=Escallonia herrerae TaxID=1293975 RepID=A0AA88WMZ8_9ASTE|nr:hypothetical protein RJ639_037855 [Escallonia herrerae]